jgi:phospholipase B1
MEKADVDMEQEFKFINIFIGSNDVCAGCAPLINATFLSPDDFEKTMRTTLRTIKAKIPRTVVNLMMQFNISQVWEVTRNDPWCATVRTSGMVYECACAFIPGETGQIWRQKMDTLVQNYNRRLELIAKDYSEDKDPSFKVILDPLFSEVQIRDWPLEYLSDIDCFHPAASSHALIAKSAWANLFRPYKLKSRSMKPTDKIQVFCPHDDSRIQ